MMTTTQSRIRKQERKSHAYLAGYSDYLNCQAVVVYGQFNISPSTADLKEWGYAARLYRRGWDAAGNSSD